MPIVGKFKEEIDHPPNILGFSYYFIYFVIYIYIFIHISCKFPFHIFKIMDGFLGTFLDFLILSLYLDLLTLVTMGLMADSSSMLEVSIEIGVRQGLKS